MEAPVRLFLRLTPLFFLVPVAAPVQQQDPEDGVFVDEIKKEFLDRIKKAQDLGDWRSLFDAYNIAIVKYQQKLVRPNPSQNIWIGVIEYLNREFSKLPPDALEYYRIENDGRAVAEYRKALEANDRAGVQAVVEKYFFAKIVDDALDRLGNQYFEERRNDQAIFYWRRLLEHYPDSEIPKHVTAAKMAMAAYASGNAPALDQVRSIAAAKKIDGDITAGGRKTTLSAYLKSLVIVPAVAAPITTKQPTFPEPESRFQRRLIGVRNDIKRWTFDFTDNSGQPAPRNQPRFRQPQPAQVQPEFPFFAAYEKVKGRDILVVTDGQRVIAVNPQKVTSTNASTGVMWRFPREGAIKRQFGNVRNDYGQASSPEIGASIQDGIAYVTVFSEKRPQGQPNPNQQDFFEGPQRLVCIDAVTGKLVWDTDDAALQAVLKKQEFFDRNWAFSTPPLVRGDNLYVGICTSPLGEPESRVVCFDRRTGEFRWHSFLASVTGGAGRFFGGGGRWVTYLTTLVEQGGVLYVHSNLGVVAAVHAVSGNVLWLSRYPRQAQRMDRWNGEGPQFIRHASWPLIHRGKMYVLPQDQVEMQVFSISDGAKLAFPTPPAGTGQKDMAWRNITQLVGLMEDWMILGGVESFVVNMVDRVADGKVRTPAGRAYSLPRSNVSRCGKGLIDGEVIYFPTCEDNIGTLSIYYGLGSFKNLDQVKWQEVGEYGNLLVAGDYLVVMTGTRAMVYTDVETIRKEFVQRLVQSPPNPAAFLEHGDIMRQNEKLVDAAESYLAFIDAAKGDPRYEKKVLDVKTELHQIYLKRGNEAFAQTEAAPHLLAIDYYKAAKGFAYDEATFADATRRLAETYEKVAAEKKDDPAAQKELAKKAVEEYQQIVERSRDSYYKPESGDLIQKMWTYAVGRIRELGKTYGDEVLEPVEKAARAEFDKLADKGGDAMRRVIDLYPQTKAALEAYQKMAADYATEGNWKKVIATLREFKEKHPDKWSVDLQRTVTEALEKLGDWRRLWDELKKMGENFGTQMVKVGEQEVSIQSVVDKKLEEIKSHLVEDQRILVDPIAKLLTIEGAPTGGNRFETSTAAVPLVVAGEVPPGYTGDHELLVRGSSVELWDLKKKEKVWTALHPGGYIGLGYEDVKCGADPGVRVIDVQDGSPAEKAGLQTGDIVLLVNGTSVNALTFDDTAAAATGTVKFQIMRGDKAQEIVVERIPWPAAARPAVVGAAFTRDYSIVVAWEDLAASVDVRTGKTSWVFRSVRDRFSLVRVGYSEGRVLIHEHLRGQMRSPFRSLSSQMQETERVLAYEDAYARLLVLDETTGEVAWAKSFPFDPNGYAMHKISFLPLAAIDKVAMLVDNCRDNIRSSEVVILALADGKTQPGYKMPGAIQSVAMDAERGMVFYVELNNRVLKTVSYGPQAPKLPDIAIQKYFDPNSQMAGVVAGKNYIAILIPPWQGTVFQKIVLFSIKTGQEYGILILPDDRTIPSNRLNTVVIGDDGTVYVYNIPKSKLQGSGGSDRRAFLTAYRILEPAKKEDPKFEMLWDAVAPFPSAGGELTIVPLDTVVILAARGTRPTETTESLIAMVYGTSDGGRLRLEAADVVAGAEGKPMLVRRGRLFIQTKSGLDIYGNE